MIGLRLIFYVPIWAGWAQSTLPLSFCFSRDLQTQTKSRIKDPFAMLWSLYDGERRQNIWWCETWITEGLIYDSFSLYPIQPLTWGRSLEGILFVFSWYMWTPQWWSTGKSSGQSFASQESMSFSYSKIITTSMNIRIYKCPTSSNSWLWIGFWC